MGTALIGELKGKDESKRSGVLVPFVWEVPKLVFWAGGGELSWMGRG